MWASSLTERETQVELAVWSRAWSSFSHGPMCWVITPPTALAGRPGIQERNTNKKALSIQNDLINTVRITVAECTLDVHLFWDIYLWFRRWLESTHPSYTGQRISFPAQLLWHWIILMIKTLAWSMAEKHWIMELLRSPLRKQLFFILASWDEGYWVWGLAYTQAVAGVPVSFLHSPSLLAHLSIETVWGGIKWHISLLKRGGGGGIKWKNMATRVELARCDSWKMILSEKHQAFQRTFRKRLWC